MENTEFDVYTLQELYNSLNDTNSATAIAIKEYMESTPGGYGPSEKKLKDYPVAPIKAEINGSERVVLVRDVTKPARLMEKIEQEKRIQQQQQQQQINTNDQINNTVYMSVQRDLDRAVAAGTERLASDVSRVANTVAANHTDLEIQRMKIQNDRDDLLRKMGMRIGVNVPVNRLEEAGIRIKQVDDAVNGLSSLLHKGEKVDAKEIAENASLARKMFVASMGREPTTDEDIKMLEGVTRKHFSKEEKDAIKSMGRGNAERKLKEADDRWKNMDPKLKEFELAKARKEKEDEENSHHHRKW